MDYPHTSYVRLIPLSLFSMYGPRQVGTPVVKAKYRVQAIQDMPWHNVKAGDFGGLVESIDNIRGQSWVGMGSTIVGRSFLTGRARYDSTEPFILSSASGCAVVTGHALMRNSHITENAIVGGNAAVYSSSISGNARIHGHPTVYNSSVSGDAIVCGDADVIDSDISGTSAVTFLTAINKVSVDDEFLWSSENKDIKAVLDQHTIQQYLDRKNGFSFEQPHRSRRHRSAKDSRGNFVTEMTLRAFPGLVEDDLRQLFYPFVSKELN